MTKRTFFPFFTLILFGLILAGCQDLATCSDDIGCVVIQPNEPIRLAYMLVTSGENAILGSDSLGGIEIALADRDTRLLGHPIELIGVDSRCSADGGEAAAREIITEPDLVGIIGPSCSSAAAKAIPIISEAGLILISPSTTGPSLTNPNVYWQPGFFRTAHNDRFQGQMAAEFALVELGAHSAATIHDGSTYASELQMIFSNYFRELGGTITAQEHITEGETDMSAVLQEIAADSPDVLYFPVFEPEGNYIATQAVTTPGLENTILIGSDGLFSATFAPDSGMAVVGMYVSAPYLQSTAYNNFFTKWIERFGTPPPSGFHAFAYDATNILLHAIQTSGRLSPNGTLTIGRQALRDTVANITNFRGISGNITCHEFGDCATGEALAIYKLTAAQVQGQFPPDVEWTKFDNN